MYDNIISRVTSKSNGPGVNCSMPPPPHTHTHHLDQGRNCGDVPIGYVYV